MGTDPILTREEQEKVLSLFVVVDGNTKKRIVKDFWPQLFDVYDILHHHGYRVSDQLKECTYRRIDLISEGGAAHAEQEIKKQQMHNSLSGAQGEMALKPLEDIAEQLRKNEGKVPKRQLTESMWRCHDLLREIYREYEPKEKQENHNV